MYKMFDLNLPQYSYKIRTENGKNQIFDVIRRKFVRLTPEEWVRQHFCNYLINLKGYPSERLVNEAFLDVNGQKKRCDSVFYDKELKPIVLIEYKSPDVTINQKVFNQIMTYNWILKSPFIMVSNGLNHYCCKLDFISGKVDFLNEIPDYKDLK